MSYPDTTTPNTDADRDHDHDRDLDYVGEDLRRVAAKLGRPPTTIEYQTHGRVSVTTVYRRWDSWDDALAAIGWPRDTDPTGAVATEKLAADIRRVADIVGRVPTTCDYRDHGDHALNTVYSHYCPDDARSWETVVNKVFD